MQNASIKAMIGGMALFVLIGFSSAPSWALSLDTGAPIVAIDGNADGDVTVYIQSTAFVPYPYQYGFFLNGGSTFNLLGLSSINSFEGGNVIDFALYDGTKYYTLSGDAADDTYSVLMEFGNPVTVGSPQRPEGWSQPYYYNANITWAIPSLAATNTNELALNYSGGNDGIAPVPEPRTLLLLGSGMLGVGFIARKGLRARSRLSQVLGRSAPR
ncbi:MAG: PEP-CTERM sorting domain-containing protein [Nitrospirota bacterium]